MKESKCTCNPSRVNNYALLCDRLTGDVAKPSPNLAPTYLPKPCVRLLCALDKTN